jgi:hypothetical protein
MRAPVRRRPDKRFTGYTDAQWRAISTVVDLERPPDIHAKYLARARTREYLTTIATLHASFDVRWGEPPGQRKRRQELRATLVAARVALDDPDLSVGRQVKRARAALDAVIAETADVNTTASPRAGNKNAVQMHVRYWRELAKYYEALQPRHLPKQLIGFVLACSRPVFPRETTPEAVSSFAYRFGKRARI